jgi:hypothetical protein
VGLRPVDPVQVQRELEAIGPRSSPGCPCLVLPALSLVERSHVERWFDDHPSFGDRREEVVRNLFGSGRVPVPMQRVEEELRRIHAERVGKGGYAA